MPRASRMGDELKKNLGAEIELVAGSNGIFDISLDGEMIFSKFAQRRFPDPDEVVELIKAR
ncbi:SelT/SelW/SelH family protein [Thermodesulfobacteriota bacterium]